MRKYKKYLLMPIKEEWLLIMETEIHGLFYNEITNKFRRYPRKQYIKSNYQYSLRLPRDPKMRETEEYVNISNPLSYPDGLYTKDHYGRSIIIYHHQDGKYFSIRNNDSEISLLSPKHISTMIKNIILLNEI